jgi:hypothetical protein
MVVPLVVFTLCRHLPVMIAIDAVLLLVAVLLLLSLFASANLLVFLLTLWANLVSMIYGLHSS